MPRQVTGEKLQWRKLRRTWAGRMRGYPAGSPRGEWMDLETDNYEIAMTRYREWLDTGVFPLKLGAKEAFGEAAERVVDLQVGDAKKLPPEKVAGKVKDLGDRRQRLRQFAYPVMALVEVGRVEGHHVASVLDSMAAQGKGAGTILKMRSDISKVLARLIREGVRRDNPAREMALPEGATVDARRRTGLSDEQWVTFREKRGFDTEIDMACLMCRDLAGERTSDLLAGCWEHCDLEAGTIRVRRPKTDAAKGAKRKALFYELVEHGIPPTVLEPLRAWHRKQGAPERGPIFPLQRDARGATVKESRGRRGYERRQSRAGERKAERGNSYNDPLRQAVWEAGIYWPLPGFDPDRPEKEFCALQTDTTTTRRMSFHGLRGQYITALKQAGVTTADVMALAGHTQLSTSMGYDTSRRVQTPDEALPGRSKKKGPEQPDMASIAAQLAAIQARLSGSEPVHSTPVGPFSGSNGPFEGAAPGAKSLLSLAPPEGFEPPTNALGMQGSAPERCQVLVSSEAVPAHTSPPPPHSTQILGRMIAEAAQAGDLELVEELLAAARRRAAAPPSNLRKLEDARKRRR